MSIAEHEARFCSRTGKIRYVSRLDAIKVMECVKARKPGTMSTYVCDDCGSFHVGRKPERLR
jgi:hypothetical protein